MKPEWLYMSFLLELISLAFFINMKSFYFLLMLLLLHSIALFIVISFLTMLIPKRFKDRKRAVFTLFFIVFPTLYVGYIFAVIVTLYLLRKQKIDTYQPSKIPSLEEVLTQGVEFSGRIMGESALALLKDLSGNINPSRLETILSYTLNLNSSEIISSLKRVLSSSEDIVRLYAFGAIQKTEKKLNETLHFLKEKLNKGKISPEEKAYVYYQIASIYYTFVHYHIADQEFRDYMLKEALEHAQKSIEAKAIPEAKLLLAKIYIEAKEFDKALSYLEEVANKKELDPVSYIVPLAEIYYEKRDYKKVKSLFTEHKELELLLDVDVNFVVRFWRGSNGQIG